MCIDKVEFIEINWVFNEFYKNDSMYTRVLNMRTSNEERFNFILLLSKYCGYAILLFTIAGILENLLVLTVLISNRNGATPTSCFIISLALSDIFIVIFCGPLSTINLILGDWMFEEWFGVTKRFEDDSPYLDFGHNRLVPIIILLKSEDDPKRMSAMLRQGVKCYHCHWSTKTCPPNEKCSEPDICTERNFNRHEVPTLECLNGCETKSLIDPTGQIVQWLRQCNNRSVPGTTSESNNCISQNYFGFREDICHCYGNLCQGVKCYNCYWSTKTCPLIGRCLQPDICTVKNFRRYDVPTLECPNGCETRTIIDPTGQIVEWEQDPNQTFASHKTILEFGKMFAIVLEISAIIPQNFL
ncbi:hypothetical protein B4U79_05322 [Dinothrombium tinctorium]|uniref:G-protein coupled receptors family 1 profile domain-containing protein n=1 Tax=Dinothrombium tinctorium TaxID=1965070 RepID=A0A3S4R6Q9_9ACAR|nr:hypothetical protein B4U79_05322 [Dinothrombium tinctorium]